MAECLDSRPGSPSTTPLIAHIKQVGPCYPHEIQLWTRRPASSFGQILALAIAVPWEGSQQMGDFSLSQLLKCIKYIFKNQQRNPFQKVLGRIRLPDEHSSAALCSHAGRPGPWAVSQHDLGGRYQFTHFTMSSLKVGAASSFLLRLLHLVEFQGPMITLLTDIYVYIYI